MAVAKREARFFQSRTGLIFAVFYLALYSLSGIYSVLFLLFHRPPGEFNPPSIAALPWSLILIPYSHSLGILNLYDRLTASPFLYGGLMTLVVLPGAILNAIILYGFCRFLDNLRET